MADETSTPAGETPASGETPQGTGAETTQGQAPGEHDPERAKALIGKLREQERANAKELTELRAKVKAADDAKLSETERQTKRIAELEQAQQARDQAHRDRMLSYEVRLAASQLGIVDPEAAALLLDRGRLELDANGNPTNAEALLRDLVKSKPYLVGTKPAAAATSTANAARGTSEGESFTRAQLADYPFYQKHKAAIDAAIKAGRITD